MNERSLISFQNTENYIKVGGVILVYIILVSYLSLLLWLRCRFFSKEKGVEKISFLNLLFLNIDLMAVIVFALVIILMSSFYFDNDIFLLLIFLGFLYVLPGSLPESRIPGTKIIKFIFSFLLFFILLAYNYFKKYKGAFLGIIYFFSFLFFSISVLLF